MANQPEEVKYGVATGDDAVGKVEVGNSPLQEREALLADERSLTRRHLMVPSDAGDKLGNWSTSTEDTSRTFVLNEARLA